MWWYLSFAENGWLGACIVEASSEMEAVRETWRREINPGGEVVLFNLTSVGVAPPKQLVNRLLDRADLRVLDRAVGGDGKLGTTRV